MKRRCFMGLVISADPEDLIRQAFREAAAFSARTCMEEGAFGFGTKYE